MAETPSAESGACACGPDECLNAGGSGCHFGEAPSAESDAVDEALAEIGRQARADEACSICHASVRPDRRDRHLDWHASLSRDVERDRLPQVYGTRVLPPGSGDTP